MQAKKVIHQKPCPRVQVLDYKGNHKLWFGLNNIPTLQSLSFSLSENDLSGSFSLSFFPDFDGASLFDKIDVFDIVKIYEDYAVISSNGEAGSADVYPVFTGIIHSKKYAASAGDSGVMRRMSVTGTAITGLVSEFKISLDVTAQAVTTLATAAEHINKSLTIQNSTSGAKVKDIILNVWETFVELSSEHGAPAVSECIAALLGDASDFFDIEDIEIGYPIGNLLQGEAEMSFIDIIESLLPIPYYEKTAYTDKTGAMKIRMRECPFSPSNWKALSCIEIDNRLVKSFDLEASDSEVYTVFYAWLEGSPISERTYLITGLYDSKENKIPQVDEEKFKKYGYKPLFAHFRGYSEPEGGDTTSEEAMTNATANLVEWFSHLDEMPKGSITLALTYKDGNGFIMPGDRVSFLGMEFYVEGISHSWTYNGGGEINLSVSRGGVYDESGAWSRAENITKVAHVK